MPRSKRSSTPFALFAVVCFLVAPQILGQQLGSSRVSEEAVALSDGVLVDAVGRVAYVMNADRHIEAIELASGAARWTTEGPGKPLAVVEGQLIAQAPSGEVGRLDLVAFRLGDGSRAELAAAIALPEGVRATLMDTPGRSFRVQAIPEGDSVAVRWMETRSNRSGTTQGYLPSEEENAVPGVQTRSRAATPRLRESGGAMVELASGTVSELPEAPPSRDTVVTRRSLGGIEGQHYSSADGRHLLASQRDPEGGVWQAYRWTVFASGSGSPLGVVSHHAATAPFVVADSSLIYLTMPSYRIDGDEAIAQPMQLQATDLASGQLLWKAEVGDPSYSGPLAP